MLHFAILVDQQKFGKFVHKGLSLAMDLKTNWPFWARIFSNLYVWKQKKKQVKNQPTNQPNKQTHKQTKTNKKQQQKKKQKKTPTWLIIRENCHKLMI